MQSIRECAYSQVRIGTDSVNSDNTQNFIRCVRGFAEMSRPHAPEQPNRSSTLQKEHAMDAIRRILVAVNPFPGRSFPAVLKAAQIAGACGAEIELFHALTSP